MTEITFKKGFKRRLTGLFLCLIILLSALTPCALAAVQYPQGITKEQSQQAIAKTDAIFSVLASSQGMDLWSLASPMICNDSTMGSLTKEIYLMLSQNAETLSKVGINISPQAVAPYLAFYPQVQQRLLSAADWNSVNLDGAYWGINNESTFTIAAVTVISPLNDLLYTILCGGTYSLNTLIGITGSRGYENVVTGLYKTLGMESYTAADVFYSDAAVNKATMIRHIITDILSFMKVICQSPASKLSACLPGIAYFINNGGLDKAVATLVEPIKINVLGIITPFQVGNITESLTSSQGGMNLNINLGGMATNLTTAPFDMSALASCGTVSGDTLVPDTADSFMYLFRWVIETLKLNMGNLPALIKEIVPNTDTQQITPVLSGLLQKSTDEIIASLIRLMTATAGEYNPFVWSFPAHANTPVSYTTNLGQEKYQRVLEGIDPLISEFVKEGGKSKNFRQALQPQIYSNKLLTELVCAVYSELEDVKLSQLLSLTDIKITPSALAELLDEEAYYGTSMVLYNYEKFSSLNKSELTWGFSDGDRNGFINAFCAAFRPLDSLLRMVLCGGKITLLGAIDIYGSDGYNTAIIPLLEAIGCNGDKIPTFDEYLKKTSSSSPLYPIMMAIDSLVIKLLDSPVNTLTQILPNLMYFLSYGGLNTVMNNLLYPVIKLSNEFGLSSMIDLSALTTIDYNTLVKQLISGLKLNITLPELNLEQFTGLGTAVTVQSKRIRDGAPVMMTFIQADKTAVLITLLRYMVQVIKTPGNESLLTSVMPSGEGGNQMFATYSAGIGDEIAKMSVDETVEWLYKLFFRERAVNVQLAEAEYSPTIIYNEGRSFKISGKTLSLIFLIFAILFMFAYINRERIFPSLSERSEKKAKKKHSKKPKPKQEVR